MTTKEKMVREKVLVVSESALPQPFLAAVKASDFGPVLPCRLGNDVLRVIKENRIRTVILRLDGDESSDFQLLKLMKTFDPIVDIIIVGVPRTREAVIDWIREGASHYLAEPLTVGSLRPISRILERKRRIRSETAWLEKRLADKYSFRGMVGKNPQMLDLFSFAETVAEHYSTILVTGETGTGKELMARAVHGLSPVRGHKLIVCDCATVPDNLFESELFGHIRGAFTGADRAKPGLFETADGGAIFLDEIGDIPLSVQGKLLRAIETRRFRPVGATAERSVDVRIIAATNRDLRREAARRAFREDLYFRLNRIEIQIPALRQRTDDIPLLVRFFLEDFARRFDRPVKGVNRQVQKLFFSYPWPGNVRELKHVLERAVLVCRKEFIDFDDLPENLQKFRWAGADPLFFDRARFLTLQNLEREYITFLMKTNEGKISKVARILDISRATLYRKLAAAKSGEPLAAMRDAAAEVF